jgi:SH3-like domain-containing protein
MGHGDTGMIRNHRVTLIFLILVFSATAYAERMTVIKQTANIRSGPGTKHKIIWKVEKYHPLFIIKKSKGWYRFRDFEEDKGWIHSSLLGTVPAIITKQNLCNIRSGPGTKFEILFTVEKGIPFKVLKRKGGWINIQHADGDEGWIHKSLVW